MNPELKLVFYSENKEFSDIEFTEDFQRIDSMISAYDSQGEGPLRKGEQPFQWSVVETVARHLLTTSPDLRVAIWFLRASLAQKGLKGLFEGISIITEIMLLPKNRIFPAAIDDESPREIHAISLAWLAGQQFIFGLRAALIDKNAAYTVADLIDSPEVSASLKNAKEIVNNINISIDNLSKIADALAEDDNYVDYDFNQAIDVLSKATLSFGNNLNRSFKAAVVSQGAENIVEIDHKVPSSREEMSQLLNLIIDYFKIHEPSHPAPILLNRVQRMMGANFEEIMAELYPEASSLIARIDKPQAS